MSATSPPPPPGPPPPPPASYAPPLPVTYPPPLFPAPAYATAPPPPPPKDHTVLIVVVAIVAVAVIVVVSVIAVGFFALGFVSHLGSEHVTNIEYTTMDGACGVTSFVTPGEWFGSPGSSVQVTSPVLNSNTSGSCEIRAVVTTTSGFTIMAPNTPLMIPASGQGTLVYDFVFPTSPYSGPLFILLE